jgi:hypothetical protein
LLAGVIGCPEDITMGRELCVSSIFRAVISRFSRLNETAIYRQIWSWRQPSERLRINMKVFLQDGLDIMYNDGTVKCDER